MASFSLTAKAEVEIVRVIHGMRNLFTLSPAD
jgi:hypothetical protein